MMLWFFTIQPGNVEKTLKVIIFLKCDVTASVIGKERTGTILTLQLERSVIPYLQN